jgi:dolichol-phosphate mannosyltransferase
MDAAKGDTVTVMDADLQDPPRVVFELIQKWRDGCDVVYAVRSKRLKESVFKLVTAKLYYRILRYATDLDIPLDTGDFRLMSRRAINALNSLREKHRLIRGMAKWIGFKEGYVYYVRDARFAGETKYTLWKMMKLAWDGLTGFSLTPLRFATYFGLITAFLSLAVALWVFYLRFFTEHTVQGWTSLMVVTTFLGGVQLFTVGILGEYVGRVFEQSKQRPLYVLESETTNR